MPIVPLLPYVLGDPTDFWKSDELLIITIAVYETSINVQRGRIKQVRWKGVASSYGIVLLHNAFGYIPKHYSMRNVR